MPRHFYVLILVFTAGCGRSEFDLLTHPVQSGRLPHDGYAVVSLIDPADAFACATHLSMWVDWERRNPGAWKLVLKRPPTPSEERMLKLFRLRPAAVLGDCRSCPREVQEYLLADGRIAYRETLAEGQFGSTLLLKARRSALAELTRSGGRAAQMVRSDSFGPSSFKGTEQ